MKKAELHRLLLMLSLLAQCFACSNEEPSKKVEGAVAPEQTVSTASVSLKSVSKTSVGSAAGSAPKVELESPDSTAAKKFRFPPGRAHLVILSAPWCQWCQVFEHTVLTQEKVERALQRDFDLEHINVDEDPTWMDLPGVKGLPSLVFFNRQGSFVSVRSGFQSAEDLLGLVRSFVAMDASAELQAQNAAFVYPELSRVPISKEEARALLVHFEKKIFLQINSHDGGFRSPARHPFPDLLRELAAWEKLGSAPPRVSQWLDRSSASALRGLSPRLSGEPLADMRYGEKELKRRVRLGPASGVIWRQGLERLPQMDPYRGLQDQVDGGVFRYTAGPGWYNPHFERRASDNLSWALMLRARGQGKQSKRIADFVVSTFSDEGLFNVAQRADVYFYRLRAHERKGVSPPPVQRLWTLGVQARAARLFKSRCRKLLRVSSQAWPRMCWTKEGEVEAAAPAPVDAVGELLLALVECGDRESRQKAVDLAQLSLDTWQEGELPLGAAPRLHRLAAGICSASPQDCPQVLASISKLPLALEYAPPIIALTAK